MKALLLKLMLALLAGLISLSASATTDCPGTVAYVYAGDGGGMVVRVANTYMSVAASSSDFKNIYASAIAALITQKTVTVRYVSAVNCNDGQIHSDVQGFFIVY